MWAADADATKRYQQLFVRTKRVLSSYSNPLTRDKMTEGCKVAERKTQKIEIRLTPLEKEILLRHCSENNIAVSRYIRDLLKSTSGVRGIRPNKECGNG
jgi:hypothetical protein